MKTPIKIIKNFLAYILTALTIVTLFAIIFIEAGLVEPSPDFFLELGCVAGLTLMMKIWWYDYGEDKRLQEEDIKSERTKYFTILDQTVTDSNDLDIFVDYLNKENRENYIKNKIGCRTPKNLGKKTKWLCFWHPSYRKMTCDEIGELRYNKLLFRIMRKADKLKKIKSSDLMALSHTELLYDTKNYSKVHKASYQIITTVFSVCFTTLLSVMAVKSIMLNWSNVIRFIGYLCAIVFTIAWTLMKSYKQTGDDTLDYYSRLKFILDKYATFKNNRGGNNNG